MGELRLCPLGDLSVLRESDIVTMTPLGQDSSGHLQPLPEDLLVVDHLPLSRLLLVLLGRLLDLLAGHDVTEAPPGVHKLHAGDAAVHVHHRPHGGGCLHPGHQDALLLAIDSPDEVTVGAELDEDDVPLDAVLLRQGPGPGAASPVPGHVRAQVAGQGRPLPGGGRPRGHAQPQAASPGHGGHGGQPQPEPLAPQQRPVTEHQGLGEALSPGGQAAVLAQLDVGPVHRVPAQGGRTAGHTGPLGGLGQTQQFVN